tara:strand:+ start:712 stop:1347 length:636 start_codon:yes stop_codon:yes gene_type:complete
MKKLKISISINSLSCAVDGKVILDDINFSLTSGQSITITGRNGVGKTLLLHTIMGFKASFKGKIFINGEDLSSNPSNRQEQIGYFGHKASLQIGLTPREVLKYWKAFYSSDAITSDLIKLWELPNNAVENCSKGQRKRIALARLSLMQRNIWVLDEPTTNLDPVGKEKFLELHTLHLKSGGLSIITTHEPEQFKKSKMINLDRYRGNLSQC